MNNLRKALLGAVLVAGVFNFGIYAAASDEVIEIVDGKEQVTQDLDFDAFFESINEDFLNDIARLEANPSMDGMLVLLNDMVNHKFITSEFAEEFANSVNDLEQISQKMNMLRGIVESSANLEDIQAQDLEDKFLAFKNALIANGITEFPTTFDNWVTSEELSAIDTDMLNKFVEDLDVNALIQEMVRKNAIQIEPIENGYLRVVFNTGRVIIVVSWFALEAIIANGLYTAGMAPIVSTLSKVLTFGSVASVGSAVVEAVLPKSGEKRKRA